MRVRVDAERCVGSGNCENAAPELFELGEDGLMQVLDPRPSPRLQRRVLAAARGCPNGAIVIEGEDDATAVPDADAER